VKRAQNGREKIHEQVSGQSDQFEYSQPIRTVPENGFRRNRLNFAVAKALSWIKDQGEKLVDALVFLLVPMDRKILCRRIEKSVDNEMKVR
jgi:hypothetical protein